MTEQSKIPVPPGGNNPSGNSKAAKGSSLIERAAGKLDLNSFLSPPVPADLGPERSRCLVGKQEFSAEPEMAPVVEVAPEQVEPEPVNAVLPTVEKAAPAPAPEVQLEAPAAQAELSGEHHPIDREHLRTQGLIVPEGKVSGLLEEFRIVKRKILLQASDLRRQGSGAAAQRVLISSPHPNEGKTFCALNLALSIAAEKENEVLLVDADFAKPSILTALDLPGGPGLMDAVTDPNADVADFVIGTDIPGLWVLPAGDTTNSDTEYLSSSRTAKVLDRLTEGAPQRIVLFDSPPALAASPAAELAKYVGQVIMVARADQTGQGSLEDGISLLSACPNIELLLNAVHFSPSGRSFGTYYGYGG